MAKTDGVSPPEATPKLASPARVAAFRTGLSAEARAAAFLMAKDELDDLLRSSLKRDSVKDAVAHAVELSGRPRREIYARALELAKDTRDADGEN